MNNPDWSVYDPRVAAEAQQALKECMAAWPGIEPKSLHLKDLGDGYAQTERRTGQVWLNSKYACNYDLWVRDLKDEAQHIAKLLGNEWDTNVAAHYRAFECPARYAITHEFGHLIDGALWGRGRTVGDLRLREYKDLTVAALRAADPAMFQGLTTDDVPLIWMLGAQEGPLAKDLSLYAATQPAELVAEGHVVGTLWPGTSKSADAILAYLREAYAESHLHAAA